MEKGSLPTQEVLKYAVDLADDLDKAHRQGIIHRDTKPATSCSQNVSVEGLGSNKKSEQAMIEEMVGEQHRNVFVERQMDPVFVHRVQQQVVAGVFSQVAFAASLIRSYFVPQPLGILVNTSQYFNS